MICKYCGAELPDGIFFCSNCGKKTANVPSPSVETIVEPVTYPAPPVAAPQPAPVPQPAPEPEPVVIPEPVVSTPEPETVVIPEPVDNSVPVFTPEPQINPAPAFTPEPQINPAPSFNPEPQINPAPAFNPEPQINPASAFNSQPQINPAPTYNAQPMAKSAPTNEKKSSGIPGFILGICSVVCCPLGLVLGIIGAILNLKALKNTNKKVLTIIGTILSFLGILCGVICIIVLLINLPKNVFGFGGKPGGEVAGKSFVADDNSYLVFDENDFTWYSSKKNQDNCLSGTYIAYYGYDAVSYLENSLYEYGLDENTLSTFCDQQNDNFYSLENLCVLVLTKDSETIDGQTTEISPTTVYYYGFYSDKCIDAANMNTRNSIFFEED